MSSDNTSSGLPLYTDREAVPVPEGWRVLPIRELYEQLSTGPKQSSKTISETGTVPVVDQKIEGYLGYHEGEPGVFASPERPVVTFANHTCAMRVHREPFSVIQNVFPKIANREVCTTEYFFYATNGRQLIEEYKGHHPIWRESYVPVAPLPEQRRIAWVLGTLDNKIELNRKMARTLEETAAAIFKARFVDFEGVDEFEDSEIGLIPKGWRFTPLGSIPGVSVVKPGLDSERYRPSGAPFDYVATGDVSGHAITGSDQVDLDTKPSRANMQPGIDRVWFAKMKASTKYLWTMRVHEAFWTKKILSTGFAGLQADTPELASFLFGLISSEEFEARKDKGATGTTMEAVNNDWIKNYPALMPPGPLVRELDRQIRPLMTKYWSNLVECETLASLRDELLPKLISGKIRVPEGVGPDLDAADDEAAEIAEELAEA